MARQQFTPSAMGTGVTVRFDTDDESSTPADVTTLTGVALPDSKAQGDLLTGALAPILGPDGVDTLYQKHLDARGNVLGSPTTLTGVALAGPAPEAGGTSVALSRLALNGGIDSLAAGQNTADWTTADVRYSDGTDITVDGGVITLQTPGTYAITVTSNALLDGAVNALTLSDDMSNYSNTTSAGATALSVCRVAHYDEDCIPDPIFVKYEGTEGDGVFMTVIVHRLA